MSRFLFSWMVVSLFPLAAQAQVKLVYDPDLKAGQVVQTEADVNTKQTLTLAGMPLETESSTFTVTRETVGEPTAEGGNVLLGEVETMQTDLSLPGGITFSFNSNNPDQEFVGEQQELIGGLLQGAAQAKWKLKIGADHKVVSAEYVGEPFADVSDYFKADTDPDQIKRRKNTELARYPTNAVKTGDTWTRAEEFQAGGGQSFDFEKQFTLLGSEDRDGRTFDKVGVKTVSATLSVADNPAAPAKVTESDLQVDDSEGTLWYDRQAKQFVDSHDKVHITGTLTLEVNGMKFPGELDLTMEFKSTSSVIDP